METSELYKKLKKPSTYGFDIESVTILQTHISFVVLTGEYAYKIKKPVNFGFLDFSTLEKRKFFCEQEIRLNKRLCPEIYIDFVKITREDNDLKINGEGELVEYAVKMKEFPQEKIMINLLQENKIDENVFDDIVGILVDFYKKNNHSKEIDSYGSVKKIKVNTDENFQQTEPFIDKTITDKQYNFINNVTNNFLEKRIDTFENRVKNNHICDCHGDLHTGNIVVDENVCIFDCIEFNKRFRYSDIASDIGFLSMDLDFQGFPFYSSYLINKYVKKSKDAGLYNVLNFYKMYRAFVRGKVNGFKLNDKHISNQEKKDTVKVSKKYFDLASYYASLCKLDLGRKRPILFVTTGLTGTGKTTIAGKIAADYNALAINTDKTRKEIEGVDIYEKHYDTYNTGMYSPKKMAIVYDKILEKADKQLKNGRNVVLDGTFKNKELRSKAIKIAEKNDTNCIFLFCNCPEEEVKKYLEKRIRKKTISDGRWEIYIKQKQSFEPLNNENYIEIDISNKSFEYQLKTFKSLLDKVTEV